MFLVFQLGEVMVSMASNLMLADERVLWMAQREAMACSRIIACLQKISGYRLATAQPFSLVSHFNNTRGPILYSVCLSKTYCFEFVFLVRLNWRPYVIFPVQFQFCMVGTKVLRVLKMPNFDLFRNICLTLNLLNKVLSTLTKSAL